MGPTPSSAVSEAYLEARSELLELQCFLQANERAIPFGPTLIKHAERAFQVLPKNEAPDETELAIAREHLETIRRILEEAREIVPGRLLGQSKNILVLLDKSF